MWSCPFMISTSSFAQPFMLSPVMLWPDSSLSTHPSVMFQHLWTASSSLHILLLSRVRGSVCPPPSHQLASPHPHHRFPCLPVLVSVWLFAHGTAVVCVLPERLFLSENKNPMLFLWIFSNQLTRVVVVFGCWVVSYSLTPWTVACQAPLSMGFPRQEY